MIDNNNADSLQVAQIDIVYNTASTILAVKPLLRTDFTAASAAQQFSLDFTSPSTPQALEFRVYHQATAQITVLNVVVQQLNFVASGPCPSFTPTPASTPTSASTPTPSKSVAASFSQTPTVSKSIAASLSQTPSNTPASTVSISQVSS